MLNTHEARKLVNSIGFDLNLEYFGNKYPSYASTKALRSWCEDIEASGVLVLADNKQTKKDFDILKGMVDGHFAAPPSEIPREQILELYQELMEKNITPEITALHGRFVLVNGDALKLTEIVVSDGDPNQLADRCRNRDFIYSLIELYKPKDIEELRGFFTIRRMSNTDYRKQLLWEIQ